MSKHSLLLLLTVLFASPLAAQFIYPEVELAQRIRGRELLIEQFSNEHYDGAPDFVLDFMNESLEFAFSENWTHTPLKLVSGSRVDEETDKKSQNAKVAVIDIDQRTITAGSFKAPALVFELYLGEERKPISAVALVYAAVNQPDLRFVARQFQLMFEAAIAGKSLEKFHDINRKKSIMKDRTFYVVTSQSKLSEQEAKSYYPYPMKFVDELTLEKLLVKEPNAAIIYLQPIVDLESNYSSVCMVDAKTGRVINSMAQNGLTFKLGFKTLDDSHSESLRRETAVTVLTARFGADHLSGKAHWKRWADLEKNYKNAFHVKP